MSPHLLGALIGVAIGALLAVVVALPQLTNRLTSNAKYPDPDWPDFFKSAGPLIGFLIFLHWAPDLAAWLSQRFLGRTLFINAKKYEFVFVAGYALAMVGITVGLLGNAWSTWHKSRSASK
jgi:tetrahydromethanopterin S-methyltransferase subunit E